MAEPRPFPPSPRRLALARASGLTPASPLLVGAVGVAAAVAVLVVLGGAAAAQLGRWVARAASAADGLSIAAIESSLGAATDGSFGAATDGSLGAATDGSLGAAATGGSLASSAAGVRALLLPSSSPSAVLELVLPLLGAIAVAATAVHLAQTRAVWLPRRSLPGAPSLPPRRVSSAALELVNALVIGGVAVGWLWTTAPQLAALVDSPRAIGLVLVSLVAALAIAMVALGIIDALVRHVQLATALAMTRDEKREDDRLAAADPRWRAHRLSILRGSGVSNAVARSALVLVGDDVAVAIAWDPVRQPIPLRVATGRRARATQLIGLARRHRVAVHRDAELAARLVDHEGPVPDSEWARLAELIAAVGRAA